MLSYKFQPDDFPQEPGVYLMKDAGNRFIYVGKAKNLRIRIGSYFRDFQGHSPKTTAMLARVSRVEYITTLSEKEALLLEASLIKKHRPRYNIVLRDDKQYVLFRLDKFRPYPALELTRTVKKDGALYFGPFTSAAAARQTMKVVNRLFSLRKCGHKKFKNRVRPCLQHFMHRCPAPCCLEVDPQEYRREVRRLEMFLSGRSWELVGGLGKDMHRAARELRFEKAALIRDQIRAVQQTVKSQSVVFPGMGDLDVFAPVSLHGGLGIGVLFIRQGKVLDSRNFFWSDVDPGNSKEMHDILVSFLGQFYGPDRFIPEKILLPQKIDDPALEHLLMEYRRGKVRLIAARRENLKGLVQMAVQNCVQHLRERKEQQSPALARVLGLAKEPERIECIDVSHQSGQNTRMGVVVFVRGEPYKKNYRTYNLPQVSSGDDYQAMREFIRRRGKSSLPWPDLLLVDGGRGQLSSVTRALQDTGVKDTPALASIAKAGTGPTGKEIDRVYLPGRRNPLSLKAGSPELLFLQRIRDEAHRFALGSLRKIRRRQSVQSGLEQISGLGPKRVRALREHFKDLQAILKATPEELMQVPGFGPERARRTAAALEKWNTTSS